MLFATAAIAARNSGQRQGYPEAQVTRVAAFRGLHHAEYDWEQNRRCVDQSRQWESDGVDVHLRDLKYSFMLGANGRPVLDVHGRKTPIGRPKEKGIDVLVALACVREATRPDVDLVILASRDTDLVPALDELYDLRGTDRRYAQVET